MTEYGALYHNTGNICNRNIRGGKLGCACDPPAMAGDCACNAKPILDDKGCYSMDKLRMFDNEWHTAILAGSDWEILDSAIDIEEPDAAHIISVALNRKNAPALVTGHMEIMRSLVALCKPKPRSHVMPFDPLKKRFVCYSEVTSTSRVLKLHTSWWCSQAGVIAQLLRTCSIGQSILSTNCFGSGRLSHTSHLPHIQISFRTL